MSTDPETTDTSDYRGPVRAVTIFAVVVALALPLVALGTAMTGLRAVETRPGLVDYVFIAGLVAVIGLVFGLLVPWALKARGENRQALFGLVLGLVAWLTGVVFWTMLPVVLGLAAALIANAGLRRGQSKPMALVGMVLGLSAAAVTVGFYLTTF